VVVVEVVVVVGVVVVVVVVEVVVVVVVVEVESVVGGVGGSVHWVAGPVLSKADVMPNPQGLKKPTGIVVLDWS
jgi:hypothetical protein